MEFCRSCRECAKVTGIGRRYRQPLHPIPIQRPFKIIGAIRIARLVAEEVFPLFGVPNALLSDRGANFLAHVMQDVCELLGIRKLNTTAYHPQCDGMVKRLNRTLKTMLRKHVTKFTVSGIDSCPGSYGHTLTLLTSRQKRHRNFYCLELT